MNSKKLINVIVSLLMAVSIMMGSGQQAFAQPASSPDQSSTAMPMSPVDETKVPHYFGPYSNYANSPFTLPDVTVTVTGDGTGATAAATIGANGAITGIAVTNPGVGYTTAGVDIASTSGTGAAATAAVIKSGFVTSVTVDNPGSGYTKPVVSLSGGGGSGTLVTVGNALIDRAFATDFDTANPVPVFVVLPTPLPVGNLNGFVVWNQATAGGSPTPNAGQSFNAYVLRPVTGVPGDYTVVFDSGLLTVPALADPAVSALANFPVTPVAVQAGDVLAFYGAGIPVDTTVGTDLFSYPALAAPVQGAQITVGGPAFPLPGGTRTYSFGANVVDTSAVVALTNATASAYGGVDVLNLTNGGSGYTMPTFDFDLPDDPNGVVPTAHVPMIANGDSINGLDANGTITAVVLDNPGSGYLTAPNVVIRDGTVYAPINGGAGATATTTLKVLSVTVDTIGAGYTSAPKVAISDATGTGSGALATAAVNAGGVTSITVTAAGTGYMTTGGIKKFQDGLPMLCIPAAGQTFASCTDNNLGQHIPLAVADTTTFSVANGFAADTDYYVIALVQHREHMSSSLPMGTLTREYVQLETPVNKSISKGVLLQNDLLDGTSVPALMPDGSQAVAVDDPHYLGPVISATKDKAVRIVFYNLLPKGEAGNLFLPVDTTFMGSGMGPASMGDPADQGTVIDGIRNPMCGEPGPKPMGCYTENRATLHLHGGVTPWISDGTPHQWITPAGEGTQYPQGVSVSEVPDMANVPGVPNCTGAADGCMTFYYTNQQSARMMFYHDHAWGLTRLNVYAGEAAGYLISDPVEQKLVSNGVIPADQIPLIIQDKTFVPGAAQLAQQDPTWDSARWGGEGNLWYEHVYMPAQNPGDPSGMSAYGRWMYGPWFWPPATPLHGTIPNPYYNMDPKTGFSTPLATPCSLDNPATWQYQTDPFCEPALIPGTPNNSAGMEQFNDTPLVNGTAYPTTNLDPKSYRLRILNAANDRFWNLQWYIADPTTGTDSEVALDPAMVAAAQTDINVVPSALKSITDPVTKVTTDLRGPNWIQIGSEGGFLPAPVVIDGQQVTTWITDPTRFDVGNVDKHSLLLGPAERADVIVDFSKFAGKTLILYNDAPAAFPARVASYDYYLGAPDMRPVGAPTILPGYGPNTRTIMQVKINAVAPAAAFNLTALQNAFKHHADGSGVFEAGQNPIIVGQAAYNSAYGTTFPASGWCNAPGSTSTSCDGYARIAEQGGFQFGFNTLVAPKSKMTIPLQPKGLHDEMNSATFDEFGRMTANLGLEAPGATPLLQNIILYPYVNPSTELIDATNLPRADTKVAPISSSTDGTQIWKITHNGVDTHPIHFHLYDVQVLNRVTWDNIIIPPDGNELGWKDTVRISPLEDTIVALRPIIPVVPFEIPNSIRELNPMMPDGFTSPTVFNNIDPNGNPSAAIVNQLVNFGWEYVYHCHILGHEEMDMMRPVSVAMPPLKPDQLSFLVSGKGTKTTLTLSWMDNSITETAFAIERSADNGATWQNVGTVTSPLNAPNSHGVRTFVDTTYRVSNTIYQYRVVAQNTVGYGVDFPTMTVQSVSAPLAVINAPSNLAAALNILPTNPSVNLSWTNNAASATSFVIERSTDGINFTQIGTSTTPTFTDHTGVTLGNTYSYQVKALVGTFSSPYSNIVSILVALPAAPSNLTAFTAIRSGSSERVPLSWKDNAVNETGFTIQWSTSSTFATIGGSATVGANLTTYMTGNIARTTWYFRIRANNGLGSSAWVTTASGLAPASVSETNPPNSPVVLVNSFADGLAGWTGQVGNVQSGTAAAMGGAGGQGMIAPLGNPEEPGDSVEPAYVFHRPPAALGSFMANIYFNPNGALTSASPVNIFAGLNAQGTEIFGVQFLHTAASPDVYQIRGWAESNEGDVYTAWVPIANAEQNIQLDWQSSQTSSLNLYVDGNVVATLNADTSLYKMSEERLGLSSVPSDMASSALSPSSSVSGAMYLDEYVGLSTEAAAPAPLSTIYFLPLLIK